MMTKTVIATTMRAKDNMITQGIKRWLQSIFAWWRKSLLLEEDYTTAPETLNMSVSPEPLLFTTVDGQGTQPAQPGITSVAVEQPEDGAIIEGVCPTADEHPLPVLPVTKSIVEDSEAPPAPIIEEKKVSTPEVITASQEHPEPTQQQRLEFLRYLVERGIVNEG